MIRKRVVRELGFKGFEYICVETREGHGVLHMIWAWKDPNEKKRASFFIPFEWLQESWKEVHGAFHVNLKRIGGSSTDARRLSRYMVAQYCGGQNALVRVSQSRMEFPLTRMREKFYRLVRGMSERYEFQHALSQSMSGEELAKVSEQFFWDYFRKGWDGLVRARSCWVYGVQIAFIGGDVVRV